MKSPDSSIPATGIDEWNAALASSLAVFNYLSVNSYPLFRPESVVLWLIVWIPLAALVFVFRFFKSKWLFYAGLIFFMVDAAAGLTQTLKSWGGWPSAFAAAAVIAWAVHRIRENIGKIFFAGIAAGLAAAVLLHLAMPTRLFASHELPQAQAPARPGIGERGNIYFLILDEHIGLAAIPDGNDLEKAYREKGFLVYSRAFSNYDSTLDSIPSYLNARIFPERRSALRKKSLKTNRLFEKWAGEGRRLNVYQSTHLDFGRPEKARVEKSFVYRESSMGYIRNLPISWKAKLRALFNNFIEDSRSLPVKKIRRLLEPRRPIRGSVTSGALATGRILEEIQNDTLRHPAGNVFFAHFMAPHSSYFYDADCGLLDPSRWEASHYDELDDRGTLNREEDRRRRYALYWNQIRCLHRQLVVFFDFLRREQLYEQSMIFIVSDHGSRIYRACMNSKYMDRLTPEDFWDGYSAFLVFKKGGVYQGGMVDGPVPVVQVIAELFELEDVAGSPNSDRRKIYLQTDDFKSFVALDMPIMNTIDN